jgi:hypothetical protein
MLDTDVGIVTRLALPSGSSDRIGSIGNALRATGVEHACRVDDLDDAELARAFSEIGLPTTVARSQGRVWLIAHRASAASRL